MSSFLIKLIGLIEANKLEKKIMAQYSQMSAIINTAPYAMYLKSIDGKIILTNQYHAQMLNTTVEKLVGKVALKLFPDTEPFLYEDEEIISKKVCKITEKRLKTIDGKISWYRVSKTPILGADDNVTSLLIILQNIGNEKELEDRKNTFIATLTHDLKTPTIAQMKALDLLLNNTFGELTEEQKDIVSQIKNSCSYMYNLIFTILDTYLYDDGQTKIEKEEFNIKELLDETIEEIGNLLKEKNQKVSVSLDLASHIIYGDKCQLKRVIVNLVANAINHGYANSIIGIAVNETENDIQISVINKAKQINDEYLKHIFDRYKPSIIQKNKKAGTGLGLYLSKQIIDAHNGSVYAMSDAEDNCTFGFNIPKIPIKMNTADSNIQ